MLKVAIGFPDSVNYLVAEDLLLLLKALNHLRSMKIPTIQETFIAGKN